MMKYNYDNIRNDYLTPPEIFEKIEQEYGIVNVCFLRKGLRFLDPDTHEPMGVFKNALCLVLFKGFTN